MSPPVRCYSLHNLNTALRLLPANDRQRCESASKQTLDTITDCQRLHIYHILGFREELLLVRMALEQLKLQCGGVSQLAAILILEHHRDIDTGRTQPFRSIDALLQDITAVKPRSPRGDVFAYGNVVLVVNRAGPAPPPAQGGDDVDGRRNKWVQRHSEAIDNVFAAVDRLTRVTRYKSCIWHNWIWIPLLSYVLARTVRDASESDNTKNKIEAIVLNGQLRATYKRGFFRALDPVQLQFLLSHAAKLGIAVVLCDVSTLQTNLRAFHLLFELPLLDDLWPALLPMSAWTHAVGLALDELCIAVFRLRAALCDIWGRDVAERARSVFACSSSSLSSSSPSSTSTTIPAWASLVFSSQAYTKEQCTLATAVGQLPWIVQMCKNPVFDDTFALQAFVANPLGPKEEVLAVRVKVEMAARQDQDNGEVVVELLLQKADADADTDTEGHVSVLVPARSRERLESSMLRYWGGFVKMHHAKTPRPTVVKGVALAWKQVSVAMEKQLRFALLEDLSTERKLSSQDRGMVEKAIEMLRDGPFTRICKRSV